MGARGDEGNRKRGGMMEDGRRRMRGRIEVSRREMETDLRWGGHLFVAYTWSRYVEHAVG
jgi:hypothetical protein